MEFLTVSLYTNTMKSDETVEKMRQRYAGVYPLVFQRSVEYATNCGDLFDILESIPKKMPMVWNDAKRSWETTSDLTQNSRFEMAGVE